MDELILKHLSALDNDVLLAIADSAGSQAAHLSTFRGDTEARAIGAILCILGIAAETALLKRQTGITV